MPVYAYNADGTLASVSETRDLITGNGWAGGGVSVATMGLTETEALFSYDALGRLTHQVDYLNDGSAGYDRQVIYNAAGQIASETVGLR